MDRSDISLLAADAVTALRDRRLTLAVAESLTGGLVSATLTNISGVSAVFLGGVVVYASQAKNRVLGVPIETITRHGAPSSQVAQAMAEGTRTVFSADISVSLTGVAGPAKQDGWEVGTVHIGVLTCTESPQVHAYTFEGNRDDIRYQAQAAALQLIATAARTTPYRQE